MKRSTRKNMSYLVLGLFTALTIGAMTNPLTYVEKMFAPANNFVNPGFEANDTGVCLGDASGSAPTTDQSCSASPSLTKDFETTNPLSGNRSLKISKAAANRQGEFIAIDFTIDRAQRNKANTLEFKYEASANFVYGSASDIQVFIADKTTSQVLAPAPINYLDGSGHFKAQWQATDNRNYQLILWIPTTTTLAWDLTLDSFKNALSEWVVINSDSDWVAYTPATAQQGFGNISAVTAKYRKTGPDAEFEIQFTTGTHSGSDAHFDFPTGLVSASNYPSGENQLVGTYTYNGAAYGFTVLMQPSVSYFTFGSGVAGNGYTVRTGSNITGSTSNGKFSFRAKVRIQGWSSGVATPALAFQNVPSFAVLSHTVSDTTDGGTATSGSWQTRTLNTEDSDTNAMVTLSSNQFTLLPGDYEIDGYASFFFTNASQARIRNITDTVTSILGTKEYCVNGTTCASKFKGQISISKTTTFEVQGRVETTRSTDGWGRANAASLGESAKYIVLNIRRLVTSTTYYAIPKRAVLWEQQATNTNGGTATSGSWFTRVLNTEDDPYGIVTLSSNQFTLQAGRYRICWASPALQVNGFITRLYDVTGSAALLYGSGEFTGSTTAYAVTKSRGCDIVDASSANTYRIEMTVQTTKSTNGLGNSVNLLSAPEIYTQVEIEQLL